MFHRLFTCAPTARRERAEPSADRQGASYPLSPYFLPSTTVATSPPGVIAAAWRRECVYLDRVVSQ